MNRTINFRLTVLLALMSPHCVTVFPMQQAPVLVLPVAAIVGAGLLEQKQGGEVLRFKSAEMPILNTQALAVLKCASCVTTENLKQDGCSHYFCEKCRDKQGDKGCPLCSERKRCSICLDSFKFPTTLACGHKFCGACIAGWEERKNYACPLCRQPIAHKTHAKCEFCFGDIDEKSLTEGPICDVSQVEWHFGWVPFPVRKKKQHVIHSACLYDFIGKDIAVPVKGELHYRINDKGQFYYRCLVHNTEHVLSNAELEKYGLPSVEVNSSKNVKRLEKPKKTAYQIAQHKTLL